MEANKQVNLLPLINTNIKQPVFRPVLANFYLALHFGRLRLGAMINLHRRRLTRIISPIHCLLSPTRSSLCSRRLDLDNARRWFWVGAWADRERVARI